MNYTENLHLLKPETTELFNVEHANSNAEILDAAVSLKASLEQVATMLEEIIETGEITEVDIGAVTTIREFVHNTGFRVGVGTAAEIADLNARGAIPEDALCIPTDGTDVEDFEQALEDIGDLQGDVSDLQTATADTGWQTVTAAMFGTGWSAGTAAPKYRKIGNHVYLKGEAVGSASAESVVLTLPSGYRAGGQPPVLNYSTDNVWWQMVTYSTGELEAKKGFDLENGSAVITSRNTTIFLNIDFFVD